MVEHAARSKHHTGWAGALAVAAELSRREYDAAITLGNTPALDLICSSPGRTSFTVQVKSLSAHNWVLIRKEHLTGLRRLDLYFVVVVVPNDVSEPFSFHILTHAEVCELYEMQPKKRNDGKPLKPGMEGVAWADVAQYLGRWGKLPA